MIDFVQRKIETHKKAKSIRYYQQWCAENIDMRASYVEHMFRRFEFCFEVDYMKFFDHGDTSGWVPIDNSFFYPERHPPSCCVWKIFRVEDKQNGLTRVNEMFGADKVYVATNNEEDAVMMALRFS